MCKITKERLWGSHCEKYKKVTAKIILMKYIFFKYFGSICIFDHFNVESQIKETMLLKKDKFRYFIFLLLKHQDINEKAVNPPCNSLQQERLTVFLCELIT